MTISGCFLNLQKLNIQAILTTDFSDFLNENRDSNTPTNLYVHIPFCDSGCVFCPYYKLHGVSSYNSYLKDYVDGIIYEIKKYASAPYLNKIKIESVHFGGGNPFLIPIEDLRKIVNVIKECFEVEVNDNWTMEGSINCIKTEEYVKGLLELGINRTVLVYRHLRNLQKRL